ncbi:hypothetical protein [Fictibacillus sp. JL2B1089]|uniref:hypothetical protein n=1 Tax=Fictibacillus sp. JL2B1089 TaxID=3399565 RepID=UPI003A8C1672
MDLGIGDTLNKIGFHLIKLVVIWAVSYMAIYAILRILKVPHIIANFLSGLGMLVVVYYTLINNFFYDNNLSTLF